jgi:hypothetical protein
MRVDAKEYANTNGPESVRPVDKVHYYGKAY